MSEQIEGTVHGKTVELSRDPGLEDGQRVEVVLVPVNPKSSSSISAAGMLAEESGLDEPLRAVERQRKQAQHRTDSLN